MSHLDNLVHRCQQGELAAFSELFQQQETAVYRLALTILQNQQDAEDAVQDVFLRIFEQIKGYQGQSAFKTWLTAIVVNSCRDKLRRRKVRRALSLDWLRGQASEHNVPAEVDQRQQAQQLWNLINTHLDDRHRLPLVLHYHERLSCAEVADILGIRISTVYSRLNTARQRLREQLQADVEPALKRG
ncbi:MAG: sigma-24 [Ardenticatenaceae bacterium]|nr:MAG: sigma-24 [Ardenticatenaceae bacterium]